MCDRKKHGIGWQLYTPKGLNIIAQGCGNAATLGTRGSSLASFAWQGGYGAFSVSASAIDKTCRYIADQPEHHKKQTFQDEYRAFLRKHNMAWDERYVWE